MAASSDEYYNISKFQIKNPKVHGHTWDGMPHIHICMYVCMCMYTWHTRDITMIIQILHWEKNISYLWL